MHKRVFSAAFVLACALTLGGCGDSDCPDGFCVENYGVNPEYTVTKAPLDAYCTITVQDVGTVDMETDYVPNVTWCENGNAGEEALKTQTVSARTFAYYKIKHTGYVRDGTSDQVYSCKKRAPSAEQFARMQAATKATSGVVLTYKNTIVCAFFVAGSEKKYLNDECKFPGDSNSTGWVKTQKYVTYNWGKSGGKADGFTQSSIGSINDKNYANRGCMGQNGSACLSDKGWKWPDIIKFFYGDDIVMETVVGDCVDSSGKDKCEIVIDKPGVIIDEKDPCFVRSESSAWFEVSAGHNGHLYFTYTMDTAPEVIGTWNFTVTRAGKYEVFAYLQPDVGAVSEKAPYTIRASGTEHTVLLDMTGKSGWVSLGSFDFAQGGDQWVRLNDSTGEKYTDTNGKRIIFDAIKLEDAPVCADACTLNATQCQDNGIQTCQMGANGCAEWSAAVPCGDNTVCSNNQCVPVTPAVECSNPCEVVGERECSGDGYHICVEVNESCKQWSDVVSCNGKTCENGACVDSHGPGDISEPPASACLTEIDGRPETILDDLDPCFVRTNSESFNEINGTFGYNKHFYYAALRDAVQADAMGTWMFNVTKSGKYTVYAYIDGGVGQVAPLIQYIVRASGRVYHPTVSVKEESGWYKLGNFNLDVGQDQYVQLTDVVFESNKSYVGHRVLFDAVKVVPYQENAGTPDNPQDPPGGAEAPSVRVSSDSDCSVGNLSSTNHTGVWVGILGGLMALGMARRRKNRA
ncbi:MAG: hypothetical protein J6A01_04350 [Proteobacteria bacterium]|nr:hypothetical protein [Pseudomonadota bacterium]